jgi:hypothetical protein
MTEAVARTGPHAPKGSDPAPVAGAVGGLGEAGGVGSGGDIGEASAGGEGNVEDRLRAVGRDVRRAMLAAVPDAEPHDWL